MLLNGNDSGERHTTSEHLQASGALVMETSSLIQELEKRQDHADTVEAFDFTSFDEPFTLPDQITDKIGEVTAATVTFTREPELSIGIELHGQDSTYWIDRYADTDDSTAHDSILSVPPLDSIANALLKPQDRQKLPHNNEPGHEFEKRLETTSGISKKAFTQLLMGLVYPGLTAEQVESLAETNVFDSKIYEQLAMTSRTSTFADRGIIDYTLKSIDNAHLRYFYENGRAASFQLTAPSQHIHGEDLVFRTDLADGMAISTPAHAVAIGINQDLVDEHRNFPLSLSELTYLRKAVEEELQFIPRTQEARTSGFDPDSIAVSTNLLDVVDGVVTQSEDDRQKLQEAEIMDDIYSIYESLEMDSDGNSSAES